MGSVMKKVIRIILISVAVVIAITAGLLIKLLHYSLLIGMDIPNDRITVANIKHLPGFEGRCFFLHIRQYLFLNDQFKAGEPLYFVKEMLRFKKASSLLMMEML